MLSRGLRVTGHHRSEVAGRTFSRGLCKGMIKRFYGERYRGVAKEPSGMRGGGEWRGGEDVFTE